MPDFHQVQLLCGLVVYKVVKGFFYDDHDEDDQISDFNALFSVARRLEKLYGGKAYVGLQIPDADTATRQTIDILLITQWVKLPSCDQEITESLTEIQGETGYNRQEAINTRPNISPILRAKKGSVRKQLCGHCCSYHEAYSQRLCPCEDMQQGDLWLPFAAGCLIIWRVADAKRLVPILESYLEQRGVALPEGYLSAKVICPNPNFSTIHSVSFPPEVVTYDQWMQLTPKYKNKLSGWVKGAFRGWKKEFQESIYEKLNFILSTAPTSDRLELKGNKCLLGEFLEFKGNTEDIQAMRSIRKSKVSRLEIQETSMFGLVHSKLIVLYYPRDYRAEGVSTSEWKKVTVQSSTEVKFQIQGSTKPSKYQLSSVISLSLSA
ncbi:uncharacterized protein LOC132620078 [Lycium barbarum]|uniref:uncharacterized protein LOC132620078 n=1 Tax=Lycium barbarum TaxID=112863 RepID=UPI00293EC4AF|nr:uncharacterized protein LOC132620078 [Lycium barbarum]